MRKQVWSATFSSAWRHLSFSNQIYLSLRYILSVAEVVNNLKKNAAKTSLYNDRVNTCICYIAILKGKCGCVCLMKSIESLWKACKQHCPVSGNNWLYWTKTLNHHSYFITIDLCSTFKAEMHVLWQWAKQNLQQWLLKHMLVGNVTLGRIMWVCWHFFCGCSFTKVLLCYSGIMFGPYDKDCFVMIMQNLFWFMGVTCGFILRCRLAILSGCFACEKCQHLMLVGSISTEAWYACFSDMGSWLLLFHTYCFVYVAALFWNQFDEHSFLCNSLHWRILVWRFRHYFKFVHV